MEPKNVVAKSKNTQISEDTRESQRTSARVNDLNKSGRHLAEAQPPETCEKNEETSETPPLNEDCLLEIFSNLPLIDLCAVSACCRQFRALAKDVAQKKCREEKICYTVHQPSAARSAQVLKCFREFIPDLSVFHPCDQHACRGYTLSWLSKCTSLKTLTLENTTLDFVVDSAPSFRYLTKLKLGWCHEQEVESMQRHILIIDLCENLKSITIATASGMVSDSLLSHVADLSRIEEILIEKAVSLESRSREDDHLTTSAYAYSTKTAVKLGQLAELKTLSLNFGGIDYVPFMNALSNCRTLEKLILKVDKIDANVAGALDKFPNLRLCRMKQYGTDLNHAEHTPLSRVVCRQTTKFDILAEFGFKLSIYGMIELFEIIFTRK